MSVLTPEAHEERVRALRDAVFERPSTETNWEHCKRFWMEPDNLAWLERQLRDLPPMSAKPRPT